MLKKLGIEGNVFNLLKGSYEKSTGNIILYGEDFPPNTRTRMFIFTTSTVRSSLQGSNAKNNKL